MQDFLTKLAEGTTGGTTSEHLSLLGKRAASRFMTKEADSLSAAVRSVVGEESLNRDQVERVTQAANQAAWRGLFHEGEQDPNIEFSPAKIDEVIQQPEASPAPLQQSMDFLEPPVGEQLPSDVSLEEAFGVDKTASQDEYPELNPAAGAAALHTKTAAAEGFLRSDADRLEIEVGRLEDTFYELVKQAHLQHGHGILQIAGAVGEICEEPPFARAAMEKVAQRLQRNGVIINRASEMQKLAMAVTVDTEHPILTTYASLEKTAHAARVARSAAQQAADARKLSGDYLRDKLRTA
jgi:hypothetical protein